MIYQPNKLTRDEFGRPSGVLVVDKPIGITSHDVVDITRRALFTRKVGHAGALDPFASGVLIILVGKATKLSDELMEGSKSYLAELLFGVATDTQDVEGNVLKEANASVSHENLNEVLAKFLESYSQFVPVYSSIKIEGMKLRALARKSDFFEVTDVANDKRTVKFFRNDKLTHELELPQHKIDLTQLELVSGITSINRAVLAARENKMISEFADRIGEHKLQTCQILTSCPKGTYIRQLAVDIGLELDTSQPACLINLRRVKVGNYSIDEAVSTDDISRL